MVQFLGHFVLYVMMTTPAPQQANMPNNTKSEREYESAIQSLTLRAKELADSVGRWNKANTIFVGITVLAAFGLFVTQRNANNKETQLVRVQDELSEAKESLASLRIADVEGGNLQLRGDLQRATGEAKSKQTELEVEQRKTAEAQIEAAKAQLALKEHLEELRRETAWRRLDVQAMKDSLTKFAGTQYAIRSPNDPECSRLVFFLDSALQNSGWIPTFSQTVSLDDTMFPTGINLAPQNIPQLEHRDSRATFEAAEALFVALGKQQELKQMNLNPTLAWTNPHPELELGPEEQAKADGQPWKDRGFNVIVINVGRR